MTDLLFLLAAAAVLAGVVTSVLVPPVVRLAVAFGAVDRPDARKPDARAIPRLGGVAMAGGIALACGLGAVLRWTAWSQAIPRQEMLAFAFGLLLVFLVGVVDDLAGVAPVKKLVVEV